jgi:tetratricopeptide (TPR) repeat protein
MAMNQIPKKIALAARLRDVDPRKALDIVGTVRALLQAPQPQGDAESAALWEAECALNAAWANVRLGRFAAAYPEAEEGLRLFRQQGNIQGAASCMLVSGIAKGEDGKNEEAVQLCQEAEALFLKVGDQLGRARAINASGTSYRRMGDSARAIEAYGSSMAIAQENGDSHGVSRALTNIGYVYLYDKKYEEAIDHARRALAMEREHGNLASELSNCCNLVQALVGAGRPQEAVDTMAGYDLGRLSKSGLFSFLELSESLSMAYMKVGRFADADALLNMGIERARRDGNLRELGSLLCTLARLHWTAPVKNGATREARFAAARFALEEALNLEHSRDWDFIEAAHEELCALCREEGKWDEASQHLEEAYRIALKLGSASTCERLASQRGDLKAASRKARAGAGAARTAAVKSRGPGPARHD